MNEHYTQHGAVSAGMGTIKNSMDAFADYEPSDEVCRDLFNSPATDWRESTIGEIMHQPIGNTRKSGWMGRIAESELAFFIHHNVRGVKDSTPCEVGTAPRRRAIRVNGIEYRCSGGRLFERAV